MERIKNLWYVMKDHIRDKIRIHKDVFSGTRSSKEHFYDTIDIHKKLYHDLKDGLERKIQHRG